MNKTEKLSAPPGIIIREDHLPNPMASPFVCSKCTRRGPISSIGGCPECGGAMIDQRVQNIDPRFFGFP